MTTDLLPPPPSAPPPYSPSYVRRQRRPDPDPASSRRFVVGLLVAGAAAATLAWQVPVSSVGAAAALLVFVVTVVVALSVPVKRAVAPLVIAVAFLPWLAVRASPWLVSLDVLAAVVGVLGALTFVGGGSCWESARGFFRRGWRVIEAAFLAWGPAGRQVRVVAQGSGTSRAVLVVWLPAIVATVLVMSLVTVLLASGDALFASFVDIGGAFDSIPGRIVLAALAAAAFAGAHWVGRSARPETAAAARAIAPARAALLVLSGLCVVYLLYVLIQVSAVALGPAYVERRTGLTYAEYARQGFFQLLAVSLVTLVVVSLARPVAAAATARSGHGVRLLALLAVLCTEVMVVVSVLRLQMYADAFGLTMLRLYTSVFAGWVGLVLALAAVALWTSGREWLAPTVIGLALLGVFAMNIVNPEALVARQNLARAGVTGQLDADYLRGLSTDAVPAVLGQLPAGPAAADLVDAWCQDPPRSPSGLSWNWSRHHAHTLLLPPCP